MFCPTAWSQLKRLKTSSVGESTNRLMGILEAGIHSEGNLAVFLIFKICVSSTQQFHFYILKEYTRI